jgi:hypothetical protein
MGQQNGDLQLRTTEQLTGAPTETAQPETGSSLPAAMSHLLRNPTHVFCRRNVDHGKAVTLRFCSTSTSNPTLVVDRLPKIDAFLNTKRGLSFSTEWAGMACPNRLTPALFPSTLGAPHESESTRTAAMQQA